MEKITQQEYEANLCKDVLEEVYEKYKHMDTVLSDAGLLGIEKDNFRMTILYELWATIKVVLSK